MTHKTELTEVKSSGSVSHLVTAIVAGKFVHLADVLGLPFVHVGEIDEDATLHWFFVEN